MLKRSLILGAILTAMAVAAPSYAHPGVIVVSNPATGATCYVVPRHDPSVEGHEAFYVESNGATSGGDAMGVGFVNHRLHMAPTGGASPEVDAAYQAAAGNHWWSTWTHETATGLQRSLAPFGANPDNLDERYKDDAGNPIEAPDTLLGEGEDGFAAFVAACLSA